MSNSSSGFRHCVFHQLYKTARLQTRCICRTEQDTAGLQHRKRRSDQPPVVFLGAKDAGVPGLRECGWVKQDSVKPPRFFCHSAQPIKCIAENKIVVFGIEAIQAKIALAPLQIFF